MKKLAIGIDIGGTRTKLGLVDLHSGEVLDMRISPTEKHASERFLHTIHEGIDALRARAAEIGAPLLGVGVGVTGFVDRLGNVDSTYGFLEFMEDYPLSDYITRHCALPCRADNDARVVALGEALYGAGKNSERVLVLTLGTGLGVGFVANGRFDTPLAYAHMAGHMAIEPAGRSCYCGKTGCLESLVAAPAIVEAARLLGCPPSALSVEAIFAAEQAGDPRAAAVVDNFLDHLHTGIGNFINIYAPDLIVIGGGVSKGMRPYLSRIAEVDALTPFTRYQVDIVLSELDEHAGILGGAALFHRTPCGIYP
ncbi:MAG: ROK family protein [Pseudomonadota bacterium]